MGPGACAVIESSQDDVIGPPDKAKLARWTHAGSLTGLRIVLEPTPNNHRIPWWASIGTGAMRKVSRVVTIVVPDAPAGIGIGHELDSIQRVW